MFRSLHSRLLEATWVSDDSSIKIASILFRHAFIASNNGSQHAKEQLMMALRKTLTTPDPDLNKTGVCLAVGLIVSLVRPAQQLGSESVEAAKRECVEATVQLVLQGPRAAAAQRDFCSLLCSVLSRQSDEAPHQVVDMLLQKMSQILWQTYVRKRDLSLDARTLFCDLDPVHAPPHLQSSDHYFIFPRFDRSAAAVDPSPLLAALALMARIRPSVASVSMFSYLAYPVHVSHESVDFPSATTAHAVVNFFIHFSAVCCGHSDDPLLHCQVARRLNSAADLAFSDCFRDHSDGAVDACPLLQSLSAFFVTSLAARGYRMKSYF